MTIITREDPTDLVVRPMRPVRRTAAGKYVVAQTTTGRISGVTSNGVHGFKGSWGEISYAGTKLTSGTLDTRGVPPSRRFGSPVRAWSSLLPADGKWHPTACAYLRRRRPNPSSNHSSRTRPRSR